VGGKTVVKNKVYGRKRTLSQKKNGRKKKPFRVRENLTIFEETLKEEKSLFGGVRRVVILGGGIRRMLGLKRGHKRIRDVPGEKTLQKGFTKRNAPQRRTSKIRESLRTNLKKAQGGNKRTK